jgi:hypothetical protein
VQPTWSARMAMVAALRTVAWGLMTVQGYLRIDGYASS